MVYLQFHQLHKKGISKFALNSDLFNQAYKTHDKLYYDTFHLNARNRETSSTDQIAHKHTHRHFSLSIYNEFSVIKKMQ